MRNSSRWITCTLASLLLISCLMFGSSVAVAAKAPKTITIWTRSAILLKGVVEAYNEKVKARGIEFKMVEVPQAQFPDKFSAALASDTAPDVVCIDIVLAPYYSSIGAFKDITPEYQALEFRSKLNPAMLHLGSKDGRVYALPFCADVSALYWNKDLFREAGLDPEKPPQTWSQLIEYASKLTKGDVYGYAFGAGSSPLMMFTFMPYVWGNGGQYLSPDSKKAAINCPEAVEALQFFVDMVNKHKVAPEGCVTYTSQVTNLFKTGKAAMIVQGNFLIQRLATDAPGLNYGVALIPRNEGKNHSSFAGGELIAVPKQSKNPGEAMEFIRFALSRDVQVDVFARNGNIPVRSDFYDNEYFTKELRYRQFTSALDVAFVPYTTKYNELYNPLGSAIQAALQGSMTPTQAFDQAAKDMQKILDRR